LWEAAPFYDRSHAEIAALFDSVYVSFYKGLGALAGAILAGPAPFREQARVWLALSARYAFEGNFSKMPSYRERALEVATALKGLDGVDIVPDPPHTNMFHIFCVGPKSGSKSARMRSRASTGRSYSGGSHRPPSRSLRSGNSPSAMRRWTSLPSRS